MSSKSTFGIKSKVILAIISIVVLTTGINLFFTYKTFKSDKEAYIYESALRSSNIATEKIYTLLERLSHQLKADKNHREFETIVKSYFIVTNKNFKLIFHDNNTELSHSDLESTITEVSDNHEDKFIFKKILSYYIFAIQDKGLVRGYLIDLNDLVTSITEDNIFTYNLYIKQIKINPNNKSSLQIPDDSMDGSRVIENHLTSQTSNNTFAIKVVSYVDQSIAYKVIQQIIYKNIVVAIFVLGLCIILSVFFSRRITGPILLLIEKTKSIANGEYKTKVEISTNDELESLGESVNSMSSQISQLLQDKQDMIDNLEVKVKDRTQELSEANRFIKTMINSLDQGLLVFGKDSLIKNIYTKACERLFDTDLSNKTFSEILKLQGEDLKNYTRWCSILFSNKLPFTSTKSLGPQNIIKKNISDKDYKQVSLSYFPINNENEELENVVVVATDITQEVKAKEDSKNKDLFVSMILKILKNKQAFNDLVDEATKMLEKLKKDAQDVNVVNIADRAMIVFHTLFGGFSTYRVAKLSTQARSSENNIKEAKGDIFNLEQVILDEVMMFELALCSTQEEINEFITINNNKTEIKNSDLDSLETSLKHHSPEAEKLFNHFIHKKTISDLIVNYDELVQFLADKLDKPMKNLIINDSGIRVTPEKYNEFFQSLVHLFRNCMDHGIEDTNSRLNSGKETEGSIVINIDNNEHNIFITIEDDGRGINIEKVRNKLIESGISNAKEMSQKDVALAIFLPNISTNDEITDLSGRGIGMNAVKIAIENLHGEIDLETEINRGTKFIFKIPL